MTIRTYQKYHATLIFGLLILLVPIEYRLSKYEDYMFPYLSYEFNFRAPFTRTYIYEYSVLEHNGTPLDPPIRLEEFIRQKNWPWYANRSYRVLYALGDAIKWGFPEKSRHEEILGSTVIRLAPGESLTYQIEFLDIEPRKYLLNGEFLSKTTIATFHRTNPP